MEEREDNIVQLYDMMRTSGWEIYTAYLNDLLLKVIGDAVFTDSDDVQKDMRHKYICKGMAMNLKRLLTKKKEVDKLYQDLLKRKEREGQDAEK